MPRPKAETAGTPGRANSEQLDRLIEAVEAVAGQVEVLRIVLDEVREEFQWAVRNDRCHSPPSITPITSLPVDPCAEDWSARVNRLTPQDVPEEEAAPVRAAPAPPPAATTAPKRAEPPATDKPRRRATRKQALSVRIHFQPQLTELVRLIGYQGLSQPEAQQQIKVLCERYGEEKIRVATEEIVHIDTSTEPPTARLTEQARKASFGLLGPPPTISGSHDPSPRRHES